jgi:lipoprotein-anchoring transpeptidase ErfK/SrfK
MRNSVSLLVRISEQSLYLLDELEEVVQKYAVSTSKYGVGNKEGSFQTPTGRHIVKEKIGGQVAMNEVFVGRKPLGVLEDLQARQADLPEDIITSRIMWLEGLEPGVNKGNDIDSYQRYIYIHGTSEEDKIGTAASHGCIRMRNDDVIDLFDQIETGCEVLIEE